jgi:hypothetical protein
MNKNYKVDKVEHVWSKSSDRWVYIEYNAAREIIGLNFMQGNEYECFKKSWCHNDRGLMEFYNLMLHMFSVEKASVTTLSFINKCMWSFHSAIAQREDNPQ